MARFKKVSADEARAARPNVIKDVGGKSVVFKGATFKAPSSWNAEKRTARFTMTSESVDRYGDIVAQAGLDITRFMENPQGLLFHNSRAWPAGTWSDIVKNLTGRPKRTEGTFNFLPEGTDEDADRAARHVAVGSIRTVSIGFAPDWDQIELILDDDEEWITGIKFNASELLECSLVPIPAQPDALAKDAGGDWNLAREVIEEILDGWAKSPEGILVPKSIHEKTYRTVVEKIAEDGIEPARRSNFVVDKTLAPAERTFVPVADMELKASTEAEAAAFVGAKVMLNPVHAENKDSPFVDSLAMGVGEVIASWIVQDGPNKGVHALAVEFFTDAWSGMFRGIKAERFLLAEKPAEADESKAVAEGTKTVDDVVVAKELTPVPSDEIVKNGMELLTDEFLNSFAAVIKEGDVVVLRGDDEIALVIEREGKVVTALMLPVEMTIKQIHELTETLVDKGKKAKPAEKPLTAPLSLSVDVDTKDATAKVSALETLLDRVGTKFAKFFGRSAELPDPPAPPSADLVDAAKTRAASVRERLATKGLI